MCCVGMMLFLPADTWIRLIIWMIIGLDLYSVYGVRHSLLANNAEGHRSGQTVLSVAGVFLSFLCLILASWHQETIGWDHIGVLFVFTAIFGILHAGYFITRLSWKKKDRN